VIVANATVSRLATILAQQREVNELHFEAGAYLKTVSVDDQAVEAEYKAHQADYATPAQVRLQYLVLSAETLREQIKIDDEAARQFYAANAARFQEPEQRRASHILIKTEAGAPAPQQQAAKARAEALFKEAGANPARFAELARQHSQDPGSAARGGDLGEFGREMMVKPFADAVFAMKQGELRGPVQSEFGYHIIRLDGIRPGVVKPFEAAKADIVNELAMQQVQRMFAEMAERFSNLVYEQPGSLEPAAKEFKLTLQESGWVGKEAATPAFLANRQLMGALFSPESLEKHQNTEAIEVSPGVLVSARVLEHKPAGVRPLAEVAADIRLKLTALAARDKAIEAGKQALQALQGGQAPAGLGAAKLVSRMQPANLPADAVKAIFKADAGKLPASVGVETRRGYSVYRINRVNAAEPDGDRRKSMQRDLTRMLAQEELKAYLEHRRAQADIVTNAQVFEQKAE
jgi:peptidyl-prolyl cis-trans isomerase D